MSAPTRPVAALGSVVRSRREMLALAMVGGASAAFFTGGGRAEAVVDRGPGVATRPGRYRLTVLGTTDTHGNVFNWDYFKDAEYDDTAHNDIGLAKIATLVKAVRDERGAGNTLLIDAGDTIQGTPLAYYYAKIDPITDGSVHPMAKAMNAMGYDAAALGNHEFNYGLDTLRVFERQCDARAVTANYVDWQTGSPVFQPHLIRSFTVPGVAQPLKVGILGLVTPGVAIWDRANVEGQVRFPGIVEQGKVWVPKLKRAGCDLVIVSCHSGATPGSSYGDALPVPENASRELAVQVAGIDAILVGHAHVEIAEQLIPSKVTEGKQVLVSEPHRWGTRLSVMDFDVEQVDGAWRLTQARAHLLNANTVPEDAEVAALLQEDHDIVITYVNSVVGSCTAPMSAATARFEDTAALDFINRVQAEAVRRALVGTPDEPLPVLSIAAPFYREAAIPAGEVTIRDVAGLYVYDNTLLGVRLTGAQVRAYLEHSASYFKTVTGAGPFTPDDVTNAPSATAGTPVPDYNYDVVGGLDASLAYRIDIARPVGERITDLTYAGEPIDPAAEFVVAVNNYRQSGGGNFPGVTTAPVVYNEQAEVRQLLIDWARDRGVIDPTTFTTYDWRLVSNGEPVTIEGATEGGRN